jgi:uncharacterized protein with GYD domain
MARYIALVNWTDQGVRNVKDTLNRANAARQAFPAKGGKVIDVYWTLGQYDVVLVFDAPDDETASQLMMVLGMQGNVRSSTMRAFSDQEMTRIIKGVS